MGIVEQFHLDQNVLSDRPNETENEKVVEDQDQEYPKELSPHLQETVEI